MFTLAFAFCWIPFVYFYGEEKEEKGDFDFDVQSPVTRIWTSFKKTVYISLTPYDFVDDICCFDCCAIVIRTRF